MKWVNTMFAFCTSLFHLPTPHFGVVEQEFASLVSEQPPDTRLLKQDRPGSPNSVLIPLMVRSFYDVLLVNRNATLDEIKLAFKRQALQVHPDKGGSKEAFHLVYQALETLSDPETRKRYDQRMNLTSTIPQPSTRSNRNHKKRSAHRGCHHPSAPQTGSGPKFGAADATFAAASCSKQMQWMRKIHELLKKSPRDVRNEVIMKDFSQKQRLSLEKWMVDTFPQQKDPKLCANSNGAEHDVTMASMSHSVPGGTGALAIVPTSWKFSSRMSRRESCKRKACGAEARTTRKVCGCIRKNRSTGQGGSYVAVIRFDSVHIEMWTAKCDLPTALEYLLLLTSVKHKMLDGRETRDTWEERLQSALVSSATEQGKKYADLGVRFCLVYSFRIFIGTEFRSPTVRSVQELGRFRRCLDPFRRSMQKSIGGRGSIYWCYSPSQLLKAWENFQRAVAETWEASGLDSSSIWFFAFSHAFLILVCLF